MVRVLHRVAFILKSYHNVFDHLEPHVPSESWYAGNWFDVGLDNNPPGGPGNGGVGVQHHVAEKYEKVVQGAIWEQRDLIRVAQAEVEDLVDSGAYKTAEGTGWGAPHIRIMKATA